MNLPKLVPDNEPDPEFVAAQDAEADATKRPRRKTKIRVVGDPDFERGDHAELAVQLLARFAGAPVFDEGALHHYDADAGLWTVIDRGEQSRVVQSFAGVTMQDGKPLRIGASDVSGAIRLAADRAARVRFFSDAPRGLAFSDGFATVDAGGVHVTTHAPEHRSRFGYPFPYTECAAPLWLGFLASIFRDDADREERIVFLQEFLGACLIGIATRFQRCAVLIGDGDNGKGVLGKVAATVMPAGATCSVPPQLFANEYRRHKLAGKLLNLVSELPEAEILDSESFKAIIAGDQIDAREIREAAYDFKPAAGHLYSCNRLPGTSDTTHAFWRRFVVLRLTRQFREGDPDRDSGLADKIMADEIPAIVAWCLRGAARVLATGAYTIPSSHESEITAWRRNADPVRLFADEHTRATTGKEPGEAAETLYNAFTRWTERNGHRRMASNTFGARMKAIGMESRSDGHVRRYPRVLIALTDS